MVPSWMASATWGALHRACVGLLFCFLIVLLSRSAAVIRGDRGQKPDCFWHFLNRLQIGEKKVQHRFFSALPVMMGVL